MIGTVRLTVATCSFLSVVPWSTMGFAGQLNEKRAEVPTILQGTWHSKSNCNSLGSGSVSFRSDAASLGPGRMSACSVVGLRILGDKRWYLDFNCANAVTATLDVVQTSPRQLLISSRPLGEACAFTRGEE